jgi:hypothetical protein
MKRKRLSKEKIGLVSEALYRNVLWGTRLREVVFRYCARGLEVRTQRPIDRAAAGQGVRVVQKTGGCLKVVVSIARYKR